MSYKILSLDGGGSWAMIQARVLIDIYGDIRGHELLRKFDMVIGNSGGSLVLASLCNDMKLSEIVAVFENQEQREQVFSKLSFWEKLKLQDIASLTSVLGPKYATKRKLTGLINVLTQNDHLLKEGVISKAIVETPLHELPAIIKKENLQLLIVGFDYFHERASFFRSNTNSNTDHFGDYYQINLCDAIHASSNAPVNYFDEPASVNISALKKNDKRTTLFWDGGVSGFNNPVLAGLIEAITNNYANPQQYCILSLGTGTGGRAITSDYATSSNPELTAIYNQNKNNPLAKSDSSHNFIQDVKKMATSILDDPPDSATFIAYSILDPSLSGRANLIRINPCLKPELDNNNQFVLPKAYLNDADGLKKFVTLIDMDMDAVEQEQASLIAEMCDKFLTNSADALPNQMIRGNSKNGLGDDNYQTAKRKWLACN